MPRIPGPRAVVVGVTVLIVASLVTYFLPIFPWSPLYPCDAGLTEEVNSCIGVTDSSDFGDPLLSDIMSKIATQNQHASRQTYYSVGYLVPLEPESSRTAFSAVLRHELQGVYLAQLRANETDELGGGPKIKVLVGNTGLNNEHWEPVAERFLELSTGPARLRAVVGLGKSLDTTRRAIDALTQPPPGKEPVAVIGSRLTADSLSLTNQRRIEGFFRVAPTNTDEAQAAVDYIRKKGYAKALLLRDRDSSDAYVATLANAFRYAFGGTAEATFNGKQDGLANAFDSVVRNLCVDPVPDVVYFAGRSEALAQFVDVLSNRNCQKAAINIVTGDDIAEVQLRAENNRGGVRTALSGNITVTYTALAHPAMWTDTQSRPSYSGAALSHFEGSCDACFSKQFPGEDFNDGAAIMGHDAVLLAVTAIRRAGNRDSSSAANAVTPGAVIQLLYQIKGTDSVKGASGEISMTACGDVERKLFPLLSLAPDGHPSLVAPVVSAGTLPC